MNGRLQPGRACGIRAATPAASTTVAGFQDISPPSPERVSGIAGLIRFDGRPAGAAAARAMVQAMAHRGPDGIRTWAQGAAALGHCMLHTTPESLREVQPLEHAAPPLVLAADARLDNRDDLLPELGLGPDATDADAILAAYVRWGTDCARHLVGDFAFAVWDEANGQLYCARDPFGLRSFYYHHAPGTHFAFGTEMRALFALPDVPKRVNEVRLADFLLLELGDQETTSFEDVLRLPGAHALTVTADGLRLERYWALDPDFELELPSDEAYAAEFKRLFTQSVRARVRSAFPVGSQLSGGIDSSSAACVARDVLREEGRLPLHTFSNIFDVLPQCDEREYIQAVLDQGGFEPHFIHADANGPLTDWERVSAHEDELYTGPNHFLVWHIIDEVARAGVRVVLDGLDGDTVVSHGTTYMTELARAGRWEQFSNEATALAARMPGTTLEGLFLSHGLPVLRERRAKRQWRTLRRDFADVQRLFGYAPSKLVYRRFVQPAVSAAVHRISRALRRRADAISGARERPGGQVLPIISVEFAARIAPLRKKTAKEPAPETVRAEQVKALQGASFGFTAELYGRVAARMGVEIRHPFMDVRFVEFCVSLPARLRLHDGWTRWIAREALRDVLPEEVSTRAGKVSMEVNFQRGVAVLDRAVFDRVMTDEVGRFARYVDVDAVRQAYERVTERAKFYSHDANAVWRATAITLLLGRHEASLTHRVDAVSGEAALKGEDAPMAHP